MVMVPIRNAIRSLGQLTLPDMLLRPVADGGYLSCCCWWILLMDVVALVTDGGYPSCREAGLKSGMVGEIECS